MMPDQQPQHQAPVTKSVAFSRESDTVGDFALEDDAVVEEDDDDARARLGTISQQNRTHCFDSEANKLHFKLPPRFRSFEEQSNVQASAICMNCEGKFRRNTMRVDNKLCANCFKIHESVSHTAEANGGTFKMVVRRQGRVELILQCSESHKWSIGMQSRKAKNWCRQCKDQIRVDN